MDEASLDVLMSEVLQDPDAAAAAHENDIRTELAKVFEAARREYGWSYKRLAKEADVPTLQLEEILQKRKGGLIPLYALVRVSQALGVDLRWTAMHIDNRMEAASDRVEAETAELEACMKALNAVVHQNVRLRSELSMLMVHLSAMSGRLRPAWVAERLRVLLEE